MQTEKIGRFEIRGELGRGAQSVVYLGWDSQLQREVAIKTMHFAGGAPDLNAVLLDEARTASKFRHPNVVPIYDLGEQDGDPYLVFERVEGRNLLDLLREEGPMTGVRAARIMERICDVLAQAHDQGIIHRDLKPSNILMDAHEGAPRVMDFGIASRVSETGHEDGQPMIGTPAYMAPEYVTLRAVNPQIDVFAAGLVLLEMVTGERVFQGGGIESLLYRISCIPVTLPAEPPIEPKLGGIILRACALDPAQRYKSAAEFGEALAGWLGEGASDRAEKQDAISKNDTLEFLLRRMRHKSDFPALSDSVSAINRLTNADGESVNALSDIILKDYALTNKILRLVNSAYYRQAGGGNISTVSRAVMVLGFDTIRNIAITVLLFEHIQDKANAKELKEAFLRANLAGLLAKESCHSPLLRRQGETAFICALFYDLGHLLAQYYFAEEVGEINKLIEYKKLSANAASAQILGLSYENLGMGIARSWNFPATIVESMRRLPVGEARKPKTADQALNLVAGFANEMCDMLAATPPDKRGPALKKISQRFSPSLEFTERQLQEDMEKSLDELGEVANILHVNLKQSPFVKQVTAFVSGPAAGIDAAAVTQAGITDDGMAKTMLVDAPLTESLGEDGAAPLSEDVQAVLSAGIQDISNSLIEDFTLNDILRIILETMYRGMGFKRVLLALRDNKTGQMTGRFGLGPDVNELVRQFHFKLTDKPSDVFLLATGRGVDIIIKDIDEPKIADKVPKWYRERIPAKTFVLFPLNLKGRAVAMIYCDKDKAGEINIPDRELTLLKTLRNQALMAIKQAI